MQKERPNEREMPMVRRVEAHGEITFVKNRETPT